VLVRDVWGQRTYLITQTSQTGGATQVGQPAGGAAGPLVISADGSTVSWVGGNAPAQTRFLNGEALDANQDYYLLRRWQPADATTIRFTGLADANDPACPPNGSVSTSFNSRGPCDGPLTGVEAGLNNYTLPPPALSADGTKIAYVATGELRPPQTSFVNPGFDLFYVDIGSPAYRSGGLKASTVELTRAGNNPDSRATPPIDTVSITPDGRYIGITTARVLFDYPALDPIGTFRASSDAEEAYLIDMHAKTIERVVTSDGGGDADGSTIGALSMSSDAGLVCFVSTADNLIFGDANGVADAFVAHRTPVPPHTTTTQTTQTTFTITNHQPPPPWVHVTRRPDGSLEVTARVPGSGRVIALAKRRGHGAAILSEASGSAHHAGLFRLHLVVLPKFAGLLRTGKPLATRVTVTWSPKAPKVPRKQSINAAFKRKVTHHQRKSKHHRKRHQ
jgi:hypothetical protein